MDFLLYLLFLILGVMIGMVLTSLMVMASQGDDDGSENPRGR